MGVALGDTVGLAVLRKHLDSMIFEGFCKPNDSIIRLDPGRVLVAVPMVSALWDQVAGAKASPWRNKSGLLWEGIIEHYLVIIAAACLVPVAAAGWE